MLIRQLGLQPYLPLFQAMSQFTAQRGADTADECWILEHEPVYTQGRAGKPEHLLQPTSIPVVQTDRGGQITYHGPGQLIAYFLLDLKRNQLGIHALVRYLESCVLHVLDQFSIKGQTLGGAPGVYVNQAKIASIGLKVHRGFTYHGLAINVCMDLQPFTQINPCGYRNLRVTQMADHHPKKIALKSVQLCLIQNLIQTILTHPDKRFR